MPRLRPLAAPTVSALSLALAACSGSLGTGRSGGSRDNRASEGSSETGRDKQAALRQQEQFDALQKQLRELEGKLANVSPPESTSRGDFKLPKTLLAEEFLWGSDVQISVTIDAESGQRNEEKTFVLGNSIVRLQRVGQRLQIVSREDLGAESDFASQKVVGTFDITDEDDESLSLLAVGFGQRSAELAGITALDSTLRNLEFDTSDGTLLMEVTLNQGNGNYTNVLESIIPRKTITAGLPGLEILPPEEISGTEPAKIGFQALLSRVGVFPSTVWTAPENPSRGDDLSNIVKTEKNFVTRYNIAGGKTIDWWVTSNIPDTLLPEIKAGVEGWNRYFNLFRSNKPVMRFMGKLPGDARIGDPRLNIILFDAVSDAGAAYESQALDPLTGYQSHSLIYLPFAWYNISGKRYLQGGDDSDAKGQPSVANEARRSGRLRHLKCKAPVGYRDLPFLVNNRAAASLDEAGRALVRSTLLHEVGHALGMDHNFKGTISGDISEYNEKNWVYSSSTMDYNPFAMEDTLFVDLGNPNRDVTQGLVQPYDRQFIDIVYNGGLGTIARNEKAYAFCNDQDHDDVTNGVDPLCRQYDFFAVPSQTLSVPLARLSATQDYLDPSQGRFITLGGFLRREAAATLSELASTKATQTTLSAATSETPLERATGALASFSEAATSGFKHFLRSGSYSVVNALTRDARLLGEWKPIDDIKQGTELSFFTGFEYLSRYLANLFGADGFVDGDVYSQYERSTQRNMTEQISGIFGTHLASGPEPRFAPSNEVEDFARAANAVLSIQEEFASSLKTLVGPLSPDDTRSLETLIEEHKAQVRSALHTEIVSASVRLIQEIGTITVTGTFNTGTVTDRPQIRPEYTHALYGPLMSLVTRHGASAKDRAEALPWLAVFDQNSVTFAPDMGVMDPATGDSVLARDLRSRIAGQAVALLETEREPLQQKVQLGKYLTAEERERHEFLTYALGLLKPASP